MLTVLFFFILVFGICDSREFVSFSGEQERNDSIHERLEDLDGENQGKASKEMAIGRSEVIFVAQPKPKNIAVIPIIVPASRPTVFSPAPSSGSSGFPIYGFPSPDAVSYFPPLKISNSLPSIVSPNVCSCVPVEFCSSQFGFNVITTRVVTRPPADTDCLPGQVYCCMESTKLGCGIPNVIPGVNPGEGQARLGQYPWSVIILTTENVYVGGGVLIDSTHVLTVAHRLTKYGSGSELKVRLGDWDLSSDNEPLGYLEVKISKIVNHPHFDMVSLRNDISVITLATPVATLTKPYPQINTICLPEPATSFTGLRCKVAGWGKDQFNGKYQNIIKEVEVPILSSVDCQNKLRSTKLGSSFVLDVNSFVCAGGEPGKDACTGDGGNALACIKDGKFFVAGLTAAGIECGNPNVPGLYVNLVNYIPWIKDVIKENDEVVIIPRGKQP